MKQKHANNIRRTITLLSTLLSMVVAVALFGSGSAVAQENGGDPSLGVTPQIAGSAKAVKPGTANHMALITVFNSSDKPIRECQGVLISPQWVLSSSACHDAPTAKSAVVALGASNLENPKKFDYEIRRITNSERHPNANDARWGTYAYEMALYKLNTASTRRPAILGAASQTTSSGSGVLQGYGPSRSTGTDIGVLRQGTVAFSSRAKTIDVFGKTGTSTIGAPFDDFILSEGAASSHVKACGDAGAPVMTGLGSKTKVLAIASAFTIYQGSEKCGAAGGEYYHVYFNVTSRTNSQWITSVVGKTGPAKDAKCAGKWATIFGTNGVDKIVGTTGSDVIVGLNGNDILNGGSGADRLCGGAGVDALIGGAGKDICDGGKQKDRKPKQCEKKKKI